MKIVSFIISSYWMFTFKSRQ